MQTFVWNKWSKTVYSDPPYSDHQLSDEHLHSLRNTFNHFICPQPNTLWGIKMKTAAVALLWSTWKSFWLGYQQKHYIMSSIPGRLIGKPSPKGEQSTLTLSLAMLFFLISKQMGKQSNSLFIALMKLLFRLLIDYLGGSTVSYFLRIWGFISSLFIWYYSLLNS